VATVRRIVGVGLRPVVLVLELVRLEATGLLVHDVLGEIEKFGD
jgi:hypothetical protein